MGNEHTDITDNDNTFDPCLCDTRHPLERDGTGQKQRMLAALDPGYVRPDERSIEDMLLFARKFAEKLRFFGTDNEPDGDWVTFIENDVTMLVAEISKLNLYEERKVLQAKVEELENLHEKGQPIDHTLPGEIIRNIMQLITKLNNWFLRTDEVLRLYTDIRLTFTSVLVPNIIRVGGVMKAIEYKWDPDDIPIPDLFNSFESKLNDNWVDYLKSVIGENGSGNIDWANDVTVEPLHSLFPDDHTLKDCIRSATRYLHGLYEQQANSLQTFVVRKDFYLTETLEKYPYHKAHIGLFLSFLRIFTFAQSHLNGLTGRHLDYYYEKVLGLNRKAASPDKAHVLFELAKNITEHLVAEDTELNAGKDKKSVQLVFNTCDDLLVNTAKATTFKNLLIDTAVSQDDADKHFYAVYASPVANSTDGIGGELDKDVPKWEAFGDSQFGLTNANRTMPDARCGFALASPQLFVAEGERIIQLVLPLESDVESLIKIAESKADNIYTLPAKAFTPRLTGKKGWFTPAEAIKVTLESSTTPFVSDETWGVRPNRGQSIYDNIANTDNIDKGILEHYYNADTEIFNPKNPFGNKYSKAALPEEEPAVADEKTYYALRFVIRLNATEQAVVAYNVNQHKGTFVTTSPILVIELPNYSRFPADPEQEDDNLLELARQKEAKFWRNVYAYLKTLKISKGKIVVTVNGLKNVIVQNDTAVLKPDAPFFPYGVTPAVNSSFYIGSKEVFYKKLNKLDIYTAWHEKPSNFDTYYAVYKTVLNLDADPDQPATLTYTASAELRYDRQWKSLHTTRGGNNTVTLFTTPPEDIEETDVDRYGHSKISFTGGTGTDEVLENEMRSYRRDTTLTDLTEFNNDVQRGFIRLVLRSPDFYHKAYPAVLTRVAFETSKTSGGNADIKDKTVNPPYTPTIRSITIDYESDQSFEAGVDQLFHLYPFGEAQVIPEKTGTFLMPQFRNYELEEDEITGKIIPKISDDEQQAALYIGLEKATPGTMISMLVQVVENSGSPDATAPEISWSYLRNNSWIKLNQQQVISDTTNGFLTSGIVEVALPNDANDTNTLLEAGKYWLSASCSEGYEALSSVLGIYTQAVCAVFADAGNDPQRLASPLESGNIAKLLNSVPQIKKVTQPFASFGGRMAEQSTEYYRRVSERLRHKGRALAIWDYEHLVLEYFPSIYKVKCISHTSSAGACNSELAPGHVCVTVISNLRNQNQVDTLKPTTSIAVLAEIKAFLRERTSRFVELEVINPDFEEVEVEFDVVFYDEYAADNGYYTNLLNEEIKQYLSPWAFDAAAEIVFGGTIYGAEIINFIEEREYVSFIREFKMRVLDESGNPLPDTNASDIDDVKASSSRSVLVSAAKHKINWIEA